MHGQIAIAENSAASVSKVAKATYLKLYGGCMLGAYCSCLWPIWPDYTCEARCIHSFDWWMALSLIDGGFICCVFFVFTSDLTGSLSFTHYHLPRQPKPDTKLFNTPTQLTTDAVLVFVFVSRRLPLYPRVKADASFIIVESINDDTFRTSPTRGQRQWRCTRHKVVDRARSISLSRTLKSAA